MINGIFGGVGDGKTILSTYFTLKIAEYREDYDLYANYRIKHQNVKVITPLEMLDINPENRMALIVLDEAYAWLESRLSSSSVNEILSWIVFQHRKRNMDICYTAQLTSSVDLRLRGLTDRAFVCEKRKADFKYTLYWQKGLTIHKKRFLYSFFNASKIWDLYDTREIIEPVWFEKLKQKLELEQKQLDFNLYEEVQKAVEIIKPQIGKRKITRNLIEWLLIKNGKNINLMPLCIQALKEQEESEKEWVLS